MPTKFYLTTAVPTYTPTTIRGAWDDSAGAVTRALAQYKEDGGAATTIARAETNVSTTYDVLLYRGVSRPLNGVALAGTINVMIGIIESVSTADMYWHIHVYVTTGDSDTPRFTLLNNYVENTTNEFDLIIPTSGQALQSAQAHLGGTLITGDRIVIEIGFISREASASSRVATMYYGTKHATTGGVLPDLLVDGDPTLGAGYVVFSDTITEVNTTNNIRDTQTLAKVLSANTPAIRDTQTVVKVLSANTPAIRDTQTVVKVLSANTPVIRASQVMVKVLHSTAEGPTFLGA